MGFWIVQSFDAERTFGTESQTRSSGEQTVIGPEQTVGRKKRTFQFPADTQHYRADRQPSSSDIQIIRVDRRELRHYHLLEHLPFCFKRGMPHARRPLPDKKSLQRFAAEGFSIS